MSYRKIYAEEIKQKVGSIEHCPSKANLVDGFYKMEIDPNTKTKTLTIDASGTMNDGLKNIPFESDDNYEGGCYKVIPRGELGCESKDHYMGIDYNINGTRHNICHKEPVQTYFSAMFDDPNTLTRFFKLLIAAIIILLVTTIFGCCYEFWLRYGNSINCLYYFSKECKNISEKGDGKVSLLDYLYPKSICVFPYQKAMKNSLNQMGGAKKYNLKGGQDKTSGFKSESLEFKRANGDRAKCITLDDNYGYENNNRPFPYNLADYAHENDSYNIIKIPMKLFSFSFLYYILISRKILNTLMSGVSDIYKKKITSATSSNIVFLLLCGLLLPYSPFAILGLILSIISIIGIIASFISLIMCIRRDLFGNVLSFLKINHCITNDDQDLNDYYNIFRDIQEKYFYSLSIKDRIFSGAIVPSIFFVIFAIISATSPSALSMFLFVCIIIAFICYILSKILLRYKDKIEPLINFLKSTNEGFINILLFINFSIILIFGFVGFLFGNMFASLYLPLSTLFNFFYIPISQPLEFFDIMKDHADLLTILFCIGVIGSVGFVFDRNTTGIMSGILVVLILYKISKGLKAK